MMRYIKVVGVILFAVTISVTAYNLLFKRSPEYMSEQFREVERFGRETEFVDSFFGNQTLCSDIGTTVSYHAMAELLKNTSTRNIIPVPKQNRYVVITPPKILMYEKTDLIQKSMSIEDLSLAAPSIEGADPTTGTFVFGKYIGSTEDAVFAEIDYTWDNGLSSRKYLLLELSINPFDGSFKVHECGKYISVSMNESCSMAYLLHPKEGTSLIVELKSYELITGKVSQLHSFEDDWFPSTLYYNSKLDASLVLGFKKGTCNLACFSHKDKTLKYLANTEDAHWAKDGYIYFSEGNQLWRTTTGGNKELVFRPERKYKGSSFFNQIHVGTDKTFLVFDYALSDTGEEIAFRRLMLDLSTKEYRDINKGTATKVGERHEQTGNSRVTRAIFCRAVPTRSKWELPFKPCVQRNIVLI